MFRTLLMLCVCIVLIACRGTPSDTLIEESVTQQKTISNMVRVVSVEKLNGWKDQEFYVADVRYELEFLTDYKTFSESLKDETPDTLVGSFFNGFGLLALSMQYGKFEKGQKVTERAEFRFRDTENGWQLAE